MLATSLAYRWKHLKNGGTFGRKCSVAGFSLVEVMIVVAIVSVILTIALPSLIQTINREKVTALSEEFSNSIIVARSAAVKSGVPVILCASQSGSVCSDDWSDGWIAFVDDDRDRIADSTETIILRHENDPDQVQLTADTLDGTAIDLIGFNYRGAPDSALLVTVINGEEETTISISPFGKPRRND